MRSFLPTMATQALGGPGYEPLLRGRLGALARWRRGTPDLVLTDTGLLWGAERAVSVLPWAAIDDVTVDADQLVVRFTWPYLDVAAATLRFRLRPLQLELFFGAIQARLEHRRRPSRMLAAA